MRVKQRVVYESPSVSVRRISSESCILTSSEYSDDSPALKGSVSFGVGQMKLTEGLDRGETNDNYSSFTYDWYEE